MTIFYVMAIVLVAWALVLSGAGILREDFPPSVAAGRAAVAVSALLVAGTLAAIFATTHKEHPREEARAEAAEKAAAERAKAAKSAAEPAAGKRAATVEVLEDEFSVELPAGKALKPGSYTMEVLNRGKIDHDLAVEGPGVEDAKTPLFGGGESARLEVELKRGTYKLYCTVPGHEQAGMKTEVTVR